MAITIQTGCIVDHGKADACNLPFATQLVNALEQTVAKTLYLGDVASKQHSRDRQVYWCVVII